MRQLVAMVVLLCPGCLALAEAPPECLDSECPEGQLCNYTDLGVSAYCDTPCADKDCGRGYACLPSGFSGCYTSCVQNDECEAGWKCCDTNDCLDRFSCVPKL